MNVKYALTKTVIAVLMVIATVSVAVPVSADKSKAQGGLNTADESEHPPLGPSSDQDKRFHEGTCQGGHTTQGLGSDGCDDPNITKPGNSDGKRKD